MLRTRAGSVQNQLKAQKKPQLEIPLFPVLSLAFGFAILPCSFTFQTSDM